MGEDDLELLIFLPPPSLELLYLVFEVLGLKLRALYIQGKHSTS